MDWRYHAACQDIELELFFPDGDPKSVQVQVRAAKLICRHCPVNVKCLSWALANEVDVGIWGGLTERERRKLQRRLRRPS
jgi:WhiB family transcriptional regulator, redox-sensing transcriptional regulator